MNPFHNEKFTEREIRLIDSFGYGDLAKENILPPLTIYQMCFEKAFLNNMTGSNVEALRRAGNAIQRCDPYRHTEEFEKLILFSTVDMI